MARCRYKIVNGKKHKRGASRELKEAVARRDGYRCRYCLTHLEESYVTLDHIIPWSRGGLTEYHNLVVSCMKCNQTKGDSLIEEIGWTIVPLPLLSWV